MAGNATVTGQRALLASMIRIARRTYRRYRCAALPARAAVRPQPAGVVAEAPANSRTSSSTPAGRRPCGRLAHNCRHARSRSWASIWFAPMPVTQSKELQIQASSSVFSHEICAVHPLLNRNGKGMSIAVTSILRRKKATERWVRISVRRTRSPPKRGSNRPLLRAPKGPRIRPPAGMFLAFGGFDDRPAAVHSFRESFNCNHRYHE